MRTLGAAIAALFVWACSNDQPPARCTSDAQCGQGRVCDTGACKVPSALTVGEACSADSACSVGALCATAMPGGLCTYSCAGSTCPSGAVCADLRASGSGILCANGCATQADCRSGYTCCPGLGACVPQANCPPQGRAASADLGKACPAGGCAAGEICAADPMPGIPNPEFPGGACTAACNANDQRTCPAGAKCVSTSAGSFCFPSCTAPTDCAAPLSACVAGACRSATASPACTPPNTATIAVGPAITTPAPATTCVPAHAAPVSTPPLPAQAFGAKVVNDTVQFTVPKGTGSISILSQGSNVPQSTVTFGARSLLNSVVPSLVTSPASGIIFDDIPPPPADGSGNAVFYGGFSPFTGMMTLPNTSFSLQHAALQGGFDPGTWSFKVNDFALECLSVSGCSPKTTPTNAYDIRVLLKPGLPSATGTVDLAFYLVAGSNPPNGPPSGPLANATKASTDPAFVRMVQTLGKFYASAGLCLGTVTVYDVPDWARTKYSMPNADDDSVCGDLSQMFTLAVPGNQMNLFFVDGYTNSNHQGLAVVGIDGTIPGPAGVGANVNSGASANGSDLSSVGCGSAVDIHNCGADEVAYIVAHEGGHFMGLFHTTEQTGDSFDPVSDTPTCPCDTCAPVSQQANCVSKSPNTTLPTLIRNESCLRPTGTPVCGGGDNLMFWLLPQSFNPNPPSVLSAHQGQVIRSNLVVR